MGDLCECYAKIKFGPAVYSLSLDTYTYNKARGFHALSSSLASLYLRCGLAAISIDFQLGLICLCSVGPTLAVRQLVILFFSCHPVDLSDCSVSLPLLYRLLFKIAGLFASCLSGGQVVAGRLVD